MISNAELYLASKGKIASRRTYELIEYMRLEFPNAGRSELESEMEKKAVLLKDLHRVDEIAKRAVDRRTA